jgi:1-deoxy-D-xylulose-5-phosphate reductoisomerase
MKKKIAILGSTGSIGKTLLNIIKKNEENYEIILLTANKDHRSLLQQAKKFKVKNLILKDEKSFKILKKKNLKSEFNIYQSFDDFNKIFKNKIDYVMSSIIGLNGLYPTIKIIKYTKKIAIANKESLICGWNLINDELKKYKTKFIPVDSEHFSIWFSIENTQYDIEKIYLTASGGPFYNLPLKKFSKIRINQALKHPNWKMGKKISIDSATMMNKVFEIIEAKNIFNLKYKQLEILVHPKSYIHAIVKFSNGMIKIIAHDTNMTIPISNTLQEKKGYKIKTKKIDLKILNDLALVSIDIKKYPIVKSLNYIPNNSSLFETVIVTANDALVKSYLNNKIKFTDISKRFFKIIKSSEFVKYKKINYTKIQDIIDLERYVRLKIESKSI